MVTPEQAGLVAVFPTRREMNRRCDETFAPMARRLDVMAWGLRSFRSSPKAATLATKIEAGLHVRILAPAPGRECTTDQDKSDGLERGTTDDALFSLARWGEKLAEGTRGGHGSFGLRFYHAPAQDFYWRQDDHLYVGPYLYGLESQATVSFEYAPGPVFDALAAGFERLWAAAAGGAE